MNAYQQLSQQFARWSKLRGALSLLHWDRNCVMPIASSDAHAEIEAELDVLAHECLTNPAIAEWLLQAEAEAARLSDAERANLYWMRHYWRHAAALPSDLVAAIARQQAKTEMVWRQARQDQDYASLLPDFSELLRLTRESAAIRGEIMGCSPYQALLDEYDPQRPLADVEKLFGQLQSWLPDLLQQAIDQQTSQQQLGGLTKLALDVPQQRALIAAMLRELGFATGKGRLDDTLHPFCGGLPDDVRIGLCYHPDDALDGILTALHEMGHGLYEANLPAPWRHQPVGRALGMSAHEAMSMIMERQIGKSPAFTDYLSGLLQRHGVSSQAAAQLPALLRVVNRHPIRIHADEITYLGHIGLRHKLEQAMIEGELQPQDLQAAFADEMRGWLGIAPRHDAEGCLQDIHWYCGMFGYFPCYGLGAMLAAQLMRAMRQQVPALDADLAAGRIDTAIAWLRQHIYQQGGLRPLAELVQEATDQALDDGALRDHLRSFYRV